MLKVMRWYISHLDSDYGLCVFRSLHSDIMSWILGNVADFCKWEVEGPKKYQNWNLKDADDNGYGCFEINSLLV